MECIEKQQQESIRQTKVYFLSVILIFTCDFDIPRVIFVVVFDACRHSLRLVAIVESKTWIVEIGFAYLRIDALLL